MCTHPSRHDSIKYRVTHQRVLDSELAPRGLIVADVVCCANNAIVRVSTRVLACAREGVRAPYERLTAPLPLTSIGTCQTP